MTGRDDGFPGGPSDSSARNDGARNDGVDEEFAKIIAGLGDPTAETTEKQTTREELDDAPASETASPDAPSGSQAGEDATHSSKETLGWVSLVLSPIDSPGALRAALDMVGSPARVVQLGRQTAVYLDSSLGLEDPQSENAEPEDPELLALLGDERPIPTPVDTMARLVSKLAKPGAVALVSFTKEDATQDRAEGVPPALTGSILGRRYVSGEPEEKLSAGLVLAGMPLAAEELLLGRLNPDDVPDLPRGPWTGWLKGRGKRF